MSAARGDRKPCTVAMCAGTLQYGRRPDRASRAPEQRAEPVRTAENANPTVENVKGWVCSAATEHFREQQ